MAVCKREVVDCDKDLDELMIRVEARYPIENVLVEYVTREVGANIVKIRGFFDEGFGLQPLYSSGFGIKKLRFEEASVFPHRHGRLCKDSS